MHCEHKKTAKKKGGGCVHLKNRASKPGHGFCRDIGIIPRNCTSCQFFYNHLFFLGLPGTNTATDSTVEYLAPQVLHSRLRRSPSL